MANTRLPVQNQASFLAGSGCVAGATTIILQAFTRIDGTVLTLADFGSKGFMTLEPNNSTQEEQISFTGLTQNANGTATLTGVSTVLTVSPYTETSGVGVSHPGGSVAIVTNTAQWYNQFTAKGNDEAVTGAWTFPVPLANQNPATKLYVDNLVSGGTVTNVNVVVSATAGATIAAGNLIYFSEVDNEWLLCDADTAATVQSVKLGIAQGAGTNGNPITGGVCLFGTDANQTGMTQGDIMFASNTAGGISSTAGTTPRVVGIATSATSFYFDPYFQSELSRYAVDSVGTDAYAVTLPGNFNAYYTGEVVTFKAGVANTGAATLAVNGGAAKAIQSGGAALVTGNILLGQLCTVIYDGTQFQLTSLKPPTLPIVRTYLLAGSPATWTKPSAGLAYVVVEVQGAGGGGGGSTTSNNGCGAGGGGGFSRKVIIASSLGATETVTTGAGGTAGASTGGTGGTGGTSSFGSHATATGGVGGTDAANGLGGVAGAGASGDLNIEGDDGQSGKSAGVEGCWSGSGGSSFFGGGGKGGYVDDGGSTFAGIDGNIYGGGGSGAANQNGTDTAGGAGAAGIVVVTEYYI